LWTLQVPCGPWFLQTWVCIMWGRFHVNFNFSVPVIFVQNFKKRFSYINTCKNEWWPQTIFRDYDSNEIELNVRKLSRTSELFLAKWFLRRFLNDPVCIFVIISPLKIWSIIWTDLNILYFRMMCTKFDWNWPVGSWEKDFLKCSLFFFYHFAIIFPWRGVFHFI
jgi:hypothetical protein